jgi:hypothetical protein
VDASRLLRLESMEGLEFVLLDIKNRLAGQPYLESFAFFRYITRGFHARNRRLKYNF